MDFQLNEEQKSLKALAREFCKREFPGGPVSTWREMIKRRYLAPQERVPWDWLRKLYDAGFKELTAPEKYGGGGAGALTAFVVAEELTRCGGAIGMVARQFLSSGAYLEGIASPEQQDEFFPQEMKNHTFIFASAQSEEEAFGDVIFPYDSPKVMKTFAYRDGDHYVINGEKQWCTGGAVADLMVVHARTDKNAPISKGQSMFFVPKGTPGLTVVRNNDIFTPHFLPNTTLHFENVRVPLKHRIGEENKGWGFMWRGVFRQALCLYSSDIGQAQFLFEYTRDYAKQRMAGGRPIIEHGNVGPAIAEMGITIEGARLMCYRGCDLLDRMFEKGERRDISFFLDSTRSYVIQSMVKVCQLAAEVLAGLGSTGDAPLEAFLMRTYGMYHGEGTPVFRLFKASRRVDDFIPTGYE